MLKRTICILLAIALLGIGTGTVFAVEYGAEYKNQPDKNYTQKYTDVGHDHWAFSYIGEMSERGVLTGYPNGYFYPGNNVTRAEFAKIMCLAAGLSIAAVRSTSYADVAVDDWFAPYVECGRYYLNGYAVGDERYYHPNDNALREDIAVALVKLKGYNTLGADESMLKAMFTDWQSISPDARSYVAAALENGLISGYEDNTFRGQSSITRAEAATLLWRAYQYGNGNKVFDSGKKETKETKEVITKEPEPAARTETKETIKDEKTSEKETKETAKTKEVKETEPKSAYLCDTLTEAHVSDTFRHSTMDDKQTIYYYDNDDDMIYKLSLKDGKRAKFFDVSDFEYDDIEITEKEVEKEVPKTVTKLVEREIPIDDDAEPESLPDEDEDEIETPENEDKLKDKDEEEDRDDNEDNDEEEKPGKKTKIVTEEVEETVYETVTETVREEMVKGTYTKFHFQQIYFNTGDGKLYMSGHFNSYASDTSPREKSVSFWGLFRFSGSKPEFVSEKWASACMTGNFDDGRLILAHGTYYLEYVLLDVDKKTSQEIQGCFFRSDSDGIVTYVLKNTVYTVSGGLKKYNFSENTWESLISSGTTKFFSVTEDGIYFWNINEGKIAKCDLMGKKISYIEGLDLKKDVEVLDFKDMPKQQSKDQKFYVTDKYGFIFYDFTNNCWRRLYEND